MFGIRPVKTLGILAILFLIFSATRVNHKSSHTQDNNSNKPMTAYMEKIEPKRKPLKPKDAIKILHHLFKEKIHDPAMRCHYKKAKSRFFVECKEGDLIKNNYWEIVFNKSQIKLLARSNVSVYIINKYKFKELESDTKKRYPEVEKALKKFFTNKQVD